MKKCKKEVTAHRKVREICLSYFKNNVITRKEFLKRADKLDYDYFNSIESISFHKCEISKCYDLVKIQLDNIASNINYKKKNTKYTIDDYIKMLIIK